MIFGRINRPRCVRTPMQVHQCIHFFVHKRQCVATLTQAQYRALTCRREMVWLILWPRSGTDSCVKGLCWPKVPRASPLLTAHSEEQNSHTSLLDLVCLPRLSLSCIHTSDPVSWLFVADAAAAGGGLAAGSVLLLGWLLSCP